MKKLIIFILLLLLNNHTLWAQCKVLGSEYLQEENASQPADQINEDELPAELLKNANYIGQFFLVSPKFRVTTSETASNAKTYCECEDTNCGATIFIGSKLLAAYKNGFSTKDGLYGLIAHEVAHVTQCRLGVTKKISGVQIELHADFLAGYFLGRKMKIQLTDLREFSAELFKRGDFRFNDNQHHGTPEARVRYMLVGASLNMLELADAANYGLNLLAGNVGVFNIMGAWSSNLNNTQGFAAKFFISSQQGNLVFQPFNPYNNQPLAYPTFASQISLNQYRIIWPSNNPYTPGIIQEFLVVSNNRIVVTNSIGQVDVWLR
ncbi:hypothetical protein J7E50_07385 [Pedobacter sp. ISL-68]|uniref:hypothetical protein n=1 Tax=unclassified Pedobacter TaxID=2628915 RepID=UPI001BE5B5C1|nr:MULTISPECIES: hypothetical protein [unclassified Pedobacter]MBT2560652.1 hypothetical protein [Pedobacter sp. ISL-64]MBT2590031.1 hypothetical protein [Pedobacter sp. ISL-68]